MASIGKASESGTKPSWEHIRSKLLDMSYLVKQATSNTKLVVVNSNETTRLLQREGCETRGTGTKIGATTWGLVSFSRKDREKVGVVESDDVHMGKRRALSKSRLRRLDVNEKEYLVSGYSTSVALQLPRLSTA